MKVYLVVDAVENWIMGAFTDHEEAIDFDVAYGGCWTYIDEEDVYDTLDAFQAANPNFKGKTTECPYGG